MELEEYIGPIYKLGKIVNKYLILEILSYLGQGDTETSKTMYEIITSVLERSDDSASNVGYALVYQCLRTITRIYPS